MPTMILTVITAAVISNADTHSQVYEETVPTNVAPFMSGHVYHLPCLLGRQFLAE